MKFEKPEMEKIVFDAEDIIMTSGGGCTAFTCDSVETCPNNCQDCKFVMCSTQTQSTAL
jgi:hypothetical protein